MQPFDGAPLVAKKQTHRITSIATILGLAFVLLLAGNIAGFASGYVKFDMPNTSAVGGACSSLISQYNAAIDSTIGLKAGADIDTILANQNKELASIAKQAAAISDNQNDANCVQMQLTNAQQQQNTQDISKFATRLVQLAQSGKYATAQLSNVTDIHTVETLQQGGSAITQAQGQG